MKKLSDKWIIAAALGAMAVLMGLLIGWIGWWLVPFVLLAGVWIWNWRLGIILSVALVMVFLGISFW